MASASSSSSTRRQSLEEGEREKMSPSSEKDGNPRPNEPNGPSTTREEQWLTGFKLFSVTAAITLVCLLIMLDTSIVATAIPRITSEFHSLADIGWYGGAYQLGSAALQLLTGKIYMNFSSKWTFVTFFGIFELGSLLCGVANSSKMLIVGRAIAGAGSSGIMNGAFTILAGGVPMAKRPTLMGFVYGISNLGLVMGPLVGGALTQYTTWRWCFYINLPVGGLVAIMLVFVDIPEQMSKPKASTVVRTLHSKLDLIGFVLFAPAAIELLLALQYGGFQFAWNSSQIIGLFCGAGITFVVFLAWEYYKGDEAMIPFSMTRKRTVWTSSLSYGLLMSQLFCLSYYLPVYFQGVKGATPLLSGVYLLPSILGQLFTSVLSGWLVGRVGYYLPFSLIGAVMVTIANGILSTLSPTTSTGEWIGYQIIHGVGRGLGMQMPILAVQNTLPPAQISIAMAFLMFSQNFGGALFLSFAETIFSNSLKTLIPEYAPSVDPETIINAGATGFRSIISSAEIANVLVAYSKSIDRVFYMTAGMGVLCFVFSWGTGWKDIRKKNEVSKA
ncbi:putative HC-toxin efflux carrier TOXA [Daldinia childiae]|uniref:putative HC-toxin efflux carrier TOXA n=1 Tax=Daldinia childiae TaxID=326645 RepID=UPI00144792AD|nr:putative HC-toxin efflux carrier TOXA [Daldinia childiae]KAF3054874.1 putative HC-toxin efflux carrier TOXA [Daldinia childiae]